MALRQYLRSRVTDPKAILEEAYAGQFLYWGDLHCHVREWRRDRNSSGPLGAPGPWTLDEVYAFGRDETQLDFVAVTDHDSHISDSEWQDTIDSAGRWNQPGRFVSFLGYEWAQPAGAPNGVHGHRNVIYRRARGPLLCGDAPDTDTPEKLWRALREQVPVEDLILIPHHPLRASSGQSWDLDHYDPQLERLVEIYSLWGSSEEPGHPFQIDYLADRSPTGRGEAPGHSVQDALVRGYRLGLVAGSESHDGRPGNPRFHGPYECGRSLCYRGGIQGTFAAQLTRDSLFDGFRARCCYATTGVKMALRFALNGQPMGSELPSAERRELAVEVRGTASLARVEIVRGGAEVHSETPQDAQASFIWLDERPADKSDWYYVRVTQVDGNMAWSSPIWVG